MSVITKGAQVAGIVAAATVHKVTEKVTDRVLDKVIDKAKDEFKVVKKELTKDYKKGTDTVKSKRTDIVNKGKDIAKKIDKAYHKHS